jgi:lysophospholipase L1-like esterase
MPSDPSTPHLVLPRCARSRRPLRAARRTLTLCAATMFMLGAPATAGALARAPRQALPVTPRTPVAVGSRYLALGDSVTFGYEEAGVVPASNYKDASSFLGYPELLGAELRLKVANAACSGETSSSLINRSAQSNGCENSPGNPNAGYRTAFPLHVNYKGSQLAYALSYLRSHRNVKLVSLMIGANDAFVCQETTADKCASASEQQAVAKTVTHNIRHMLSAIRHKAHYAGQLAIVNYYSLDYSSPASNAQTMFLNKVQDSAAKPFHVEIADGFGEWRVASIHSGGSPCTAGLLTQLGTPSKCGIHPSYSGQSLLAQALEKAIRL